ncbi:MAG: hypothetical protein GX023_08340, partial [Tissierellia bacterium]|nr:hypothetical protein [Tissierellia bacterium]
AWARNENSIKTAIEYNEQFKDTDHITLPYLVDDELIKGLVEEEYEKNIKI